MPSSSLAGDLASAACPVYYGGDAAIATPTSLWCLAGCHRRVSPPQPRHMLAHAAQPEQITDAHDWSGVVKVRAEVSFARCDAPRMRELNACRNFPHPT